MLGFFQKINGSKFASLCALFAIFVSFSHFSTVHAAGENSQINKNSESANSDVPILIIRFNQKYVYFQDPLKKVVAEVDKIQTDAVYEVQSVVPATFQNDDDQRQIKNSEIRLRTVIAELNKLGVGQVRLSSNTIYSNDVKNQEIRIFVK